MLMLTDTWRICYMYNFVILAHIHTIVLLIAFKTINASIACNDSCKRWTKKRLSAITVTSRCVPCVPKHPEQNGHSSSSLEASKCLIWTLNIWKKTPSIFNNIISRTKICYLLKCVHFNHKIIVCNFASVDSQGKKKKNLNSLKTFCFLC